MATKKQVWFGMKLTPEERQKITRLAEQHGTSAKEAVMRLIDDALSHEQIEIQPGSFLDGIEEIIGSVEGPPDLSTNPKYLDGFGR